MIPRFLYKRIKSLFYHGNHVIVDIVNGTNMAIWLLYKRQDCLPKCFHNIYFQISNCNALKPN